MYGHIASYVDTHVPRPQSYWSEWTLPAFYPPDTAQPAYCAGGPYDGQPCDSDYGCGAAPGEAGHCKLMYPGQASDSDTYVPRPDERLGYLCATRRGWSLFLLAVFDTVSACAFNDLLLSHLHSIMTWTTGPPPSSRLRRA